MVATLGMLGVFLPSHANVDDAFCLPRFSPVSGLGIGIGLGLGVWTRCQRDTTGSPQGVDRLSSIAPHQSSAHEPGGIAEGFRDGFGRS